jgi:hypothetical protein
MRRRKARGFPRALRLDYKHCLRSTISVLNHMLFSLEIVDGIAPWSLLASTTPTIPSIYAFRSWRRLIDNTDYILRLKMKHPPSRLCSVVVPLWAIYDASSGIAAVR